MFDRLFPNEILLIFPTALPGKGLDEIYLDFEETSYTLREFYAEIEQLSGVSKELMGAADDI